MTCQLTAGDKIRPAGASRQSGANKAPPEHIRDPNRRRDVSIAVPTKDHRYRAFPIARDDDLKCRAFVGRAPTNRSVGERSSRAVSDRAHLRLTICGNRVRSRAQNVTGAQ